MLSASNQNSLTLKTSTCIFKSHWKNRGPVNTNVLPFILKKKTLTFPGFALGSMLLDALRITQYFQTPDRVDCYDGHIYVVQCVARLIFAMMEAHFLFKNHKVKLFFLSTVNFSFQKISSAVQCHKNVSIVTKVRLKSP